jgi:hypothetical protein
MSLGVIFRDLGAALEPKTPTGKRVDDVSSIAGLCRRFSMVPGVPGDARSASRNSSWLRTVIEPLGERLGLPPGVTVAA